MRRPRWQESPSASRTRRGLAGQIVVRVGVECFAGTSVPVTLVAAALHEGIPARRIFKTWPALTHADIQAASRLIKQ